MEICNKCKKEQPSSEFYSYSKICKTCRKEFRNPEKARESRKRWVEKNKQRQLEMMTNWRKENRDDVRSYNRARRAKLANVASEPYTVRQVLSKYRAICHLCKEPIDLNAPRSVKVSGWEKGLQIDHVIEIHAGGADVLENVRPSHGLCNVSRPRPNKRKRG